MRPLGVFWLEALDPLGQDGHAVLVALDDGADEQRGVPHLSHIVAIGCHDRKVRKVLSSS